MSAAPLCRTCCSVQHAGRQHVGLACQRDNLCCADGMRLVWLQLLYCQDGLAFDAELAGLKIMRTSERFGF